jgi:hypothetical protein
MLLERNQILTAKIEELETDPSSIVRDRDRDRDRTHETNSPVFQNSQVKRMQEQYNTLQAQNKTLSQQNSELIDHCRSMETVREKRSAEIEI